MLEIKNLHAKVGEKEILKGIDLTIRDGEIHALMGTNGAGKSTILKHLIRQLMPISGKVLYLENMILKILCQKIQKEEKYTIPKWKKLKN